MRVLDRKAQISRRVNHENRRMDWNGKGFKLLTIVYEIREAGEALAQGAFKPARLAGPKMNSSVPQRSVWCGSKSENPA